jgi:hypothetical protein
MLKKAALICLFIISAGCQGADLAADLAPGAGSDRAPAAGTLESPAEFTRPIGTQALPPCVPNALKRREALSFVVGQALTAEHEEEEEEEEKEKWDVKLERFLINKAKEAIEGQLTSLFVGLAEDFVRDFLDIKKDLPNLSEQSLERIRQIVREEVEEIVERFAAGEARSEMATVQELLREYVTYVDSAGCVDHALLNDLNTLSASLVNHQIFSPDTTNNYFFMADIYATSASLRISILAERFAVRMVPDNTFVRQRAAEMHATLDDMLEKISSYVAARVRLVEGSGCPGSQFCLYEVFDDFNGTVRSFRRDLPGAANWQSHLYASYVRKLGGVASHETKNRLNQIANAN